MTNALDFMREYDKAFKAGYETAQIDRNAIIEECARVVDCLGRDVNTAPAFDCAAAAIRALKGQRS